MSRRVLTLLVTLSFCVPFTFAQESESTGISADAMKHVEEARTIFVAATKKAGAEKNQGFQQAYSSLEKAEASDPLMPPARLMWSKMLFSAGDSKTAVVSLQAAITERVEDPEIYLLLANVARQQGNFAEASLLLDKSQQVLDDWNPDHPRHNGVTGQILSVRALVATSRVQVARQVKNEELVEDYQQETLEHLNAWVIVNPKNADAHQRLAMALFETGDEEKAVEQFSKAREFATNLPSTDVWIARAYTQKGDVNSARDHLVKAAEDNENDLAIRRACGEVHLATGQLDTAESHLVAALKLDRNDLLANRLYVVLLRFRKDWASAEKRLQALITQHPTDFETAALLSLTLTELDTDVAKRRAVEVATVLSQRFNASTVQGRRARVILAWAVLKFGREDSAKQILAQVFQSGLQSTLVVSDESFILAKMLADSNQNDAALRLLDSVLAKPTQFPKRAEAEELAASLR